MTLRRVLHFPNPRLRLKSKPVETITPETHTLIDDMFETMYAEDGIGLAAPQIDVQQRIIVMDHSDERNTPWHFINPEILSAEGTQQELGEGCLSVPDIYEKIIRAAKIKARYLTRDEKTHELEASGLLAICMQHEIDHLDGKLFIDYLSPLKRQRIEKKIDKLHKLKI